MIERKQTYVPMVNRLIAIGLVACTAPRLVTAQAPRPVTRAEALAAALAAGPRLAVARADSGAAAAGVVLAREFANPVVGFQYTESTPRHHYTFDLPLDLPWLRTARVGSARAGRDAVLHRYAFERESVTYDADTTYTRGLTAAARARLSIRSAGDADSLLTLARLRRDAGDASELDVQLALVSAGQLANAAAADSLEATSALLAVQATMGLPSGTPTISLADTLEADVAPGLTPTAPPLLVLAAESQVLAAERALSFERRSLFTAPSLSLGYDSHDPGGTGGKVLPMIGFGLHVPLFNQNRGAIRLAAAQRDRAQAELAMALIETGIARSRAERGLAVARERLQRSGRLVGAANRVAALSLLAYQEGAAALPSVLEAQRTAREALTQYFEDLAATRNAAGLLRLLTLTGGRTDR